MSDASNEFYQRQNDVLFASFSDSTGDRNLVVAAVTGKKIRVVSWTMNAAGGENDITWETAAVAISGALEIANNATHTASYQGGLFETVAGEALNLSMSTATLVAGHVTYILI